MSNPRGRFGVHGGQYIPETLMNAVIELEAAYDEAKADPAFQADCDAAAQISHRFAPCIPCTAW